jgi:biopolymer transport protein ExbD
MNRPAINVTPLIDVLLVMLIIFMVSAPLRPRSLPARVPAEPDNFDSTRPHPDTLVVQVNSDGKLSLNREAVEGSVTELGALSDRLKAVFAARLAAGSPSDHPLAKDVARPYADNIERTVFIKAPRSEAYGDVARIVDAVKAAGAYPISLQIDGLDR